MRRGSEAREPRPDRSVSAGSLKVRRTQELAALRSAARSGWRFVVAGGAKGAAPHEQIAGALAVVAAGIGELTRLPGVLAICGVAQLILGLADPQVGAGLIFGQSGDAAGCARRAAGRRCSRPGDTA